MKELLSSKNILLSLVEKTRNTIPLLTDERLFENETKVKINELTNKINLLTQKFQKRSLTIMKMN